MRQGKRRQFGQAMTEYVIVVALVAISAIAVYQSLGTVVRSQTAAMARELAGESGSTETATAQGAAKEAATQATVRTLKTFTNSIK